jgi:hypothetical protein
VAGGIVLLVEIGRVVLGHMSFGRQRRMLAHSNVPVVVVLFEKSKLRLIECPDRVVEAQLHKLVDVLKVEIIT